MAIIEKNYLDFNGLQSYDSLLKAIIPEADESTIVTDGTTGKIKVKNPPVQLTQAEYNALSEADKTNGTIYYITDYTGGGGSQVQSDWNQTDNTQVDYIKNKPNITSLLAEKVDKVEGKGLSTNDYDDTAKTIVSNVTSALSEKWDKSSQKVAGAYNFLQHAATSQVVGEGSNAVTFTVNADRSITASRSTTGSSKVTLSIYLTNALDLGDYNLVGCPPNGNSAYYLEFGCRNYDNSNFYVLDYGTGYVINNAKVWRFILNINAAFSGAVTFKPMVTSDLTATYDDYVPYCMSNKMLMDDASPVYHEQNGVSSFSKMLEIGKSYIFYTAGGAGAYNYAWLAHPVLPTYTYITQLAAGTNPNVTISSSGTTVTVSCSSTTILMGYYKV